jgi:hypothetical protein
VLICRFVFDLLNFTDVDFLKKHNASLKSELEQLLSIPAAVVSATAAKKKDGE